MEKNETIEKVEITFANEIQQISDYDKGRWYGRIEGAKWQQERMYTEEEIKQMFNRYNEFIAHYDIEEWQDWINKQFKK